MAPSRYAIVFDLDGTLVDTAADLAAATNDALGAAGRRRLEIAEVRVMIGGGFPNLIDQALRATGGPLAGDPFDGVVARARAHYGAHVADLSRPYPGVVETLAALAGGGFRMGVCTNKPAEPSERILEKLGLAEHLPVVVGGDSLPVLKPDPATLLEVLDRLGAQPSAGVLVGDSATDVTLGRAAGVPVIVVAGGYGGEPAEALGGDAVINHFDELAAALARLP